MLNCKRKELNCSYTLSTHVSEIESEWDALLPEGHHLKISALQALLNAGPGNTVFAFLLLRQQDRCIGLAFLQLLNFGKDAIPSGLTEHKSGAWFQSLLLPEQMSVLICGHIFRSDFPGYYFPDREKENLLLPVLAHAERKIPVPFKLMGTWLKDIPPGSFPEQSFSNGFRPIRQDVVMDMHIRPEWHAFDDYVSDLSGKYRQRAGKIIRQGSEIEVRELKTEEVVLREKEIYAMYLLVAERQSVQVALLPGRYFSSCKQGYGNDFRVFGYFHQGKMCAFSSHILKPEGRMELHYIGFEPSANETFALYFNILFDGLKQAILLKRQVLELGRTSLDAKANLGAEPRQLFHSFRVKRGIPSLLFRYLNQWAGTAEPDTWRNRNPLKTKVVIDEPTVDA